MGNKKFIKKAKVARKEFFAELNSFEHSPEFHAKSIYLVHLFNIMLDTIENPVIEP